MGIGTLFMEAFIEFFCQLEISRNKIRETCGFLAVAILCSLGKDRFKHLSLKNMPSVLKLLKNNWSLWRKLKAEEMKADSNKTPSRNLELTYWARQLVRAWYCDESNSCLNCLKVMKSGGNILRLGFRKFLHKAMFSIYWCLMFGKLF